MMEEENKIDKIFREQLDQAESPEPLEPWEQLSKKLQAKGFSGPSVDASGWKKSLKYVLLLFLSSVAFLSQDEGNIQIKKEYANVLSEKNSRQNVQSHSVETGGDASAINDPKADSKSKSSSSNPLVSEKNELSATQNSNSVKEKNSIAIQKNNERSSPVINLSDELSGNKEHKKPNSNQNALIKNKFLVKQFKQNRVYNSDSIAKNIIVQNALPAEKEIATLNHDQSADQNKSDQRNVISTSQKLLDLDIEKRNEENILKRSQGIVSRKNRAETKTDSVLLYNSEQLKKQEFTSETVGDSAFSKNQNRVVESEDKIINSGFVKKLVSGVVLNETNDTIHQSVRASGENFKTDSSALVNPNLKTDVNEDSTLVKIDTAGKIKNQVADKKSKTNTGSSNKYSVGFSLLPTMSNVEQRYVNGSISRSSAAPEKRLHPGLDFALSFRMQLNSGLFFGTGLLTSTFRQIFQVNEVSTKRDTLSTTKYDPGSSTYRVVLTNGRIFDPLAIPLQPNQSDQPIVPVTPAGPSNLFPWQYTIRDSLIARQSTRKVTLQYVGIPLLAGYSFGKGKWNMSVSGGLLVNIPVRKKSTLYIEYDTAGVKPQSQSYIQKRTDGAVTYTSFSTSGNDPYSVRAVNAFGELRQWQLMFMGGAELNYQLTPAWTLSGGPIVRYALSSAFSGKEMVSTIPYAISLKVGIHYRFK